METLFALDSDSGEFFGEASFGDIPDYNELETHKKTVEGSLEEKVISQEEQDKSSSSTNIPIEKVAKNKGFKHRLMKAVSTLFLRGSIHKIK